MAVNEKEFMSFVEKVSKLETMEFLGVARILSVPLVIESEDKDIEKAQGREFDAILSDMMDAYISLNRTQRRNLDAIIKKAIKNKHK